MEYILNFFDILTSLGPSVMMPLIIMLMALALGTGPSKALRAGLTVGVGFIGLNVIIGLLSDTIGPAAQTMVSNLGLNLNVLDVGWPTAASIAFSTKVGAFIIPVCLLVNIIMLITNTTQTANIDIWNYWQFAFTGSLVTVITNSTTLGLLAAVLNLVIILVIADITAPKVEEYTGLSGVSIPHTFSSTYAPIAYGIDFIISKIPGINKIDIDVNVLEKKLGVLGDPLVIGTVIGLVIGILAYGIGAYEKYLTIAVTLGATLVLIPKMAEFLGKGLKPVSDEAQVFINKRFKNRNKLYIGLDSAVALSNPTALAVGLLLTPIMILLAFLVPGNQLIPFTDLSAIPFMLVMVVPMCRGNAFRTLIVGIIIIAVGLLMSTAIAPVFTQAAATTTFTTPEGFEQISCIANGASPLPYLFVKASQLLKGIFLPVLFIATSLILCVYNGIRIRKQGKNEEQAQ